MLDLKKRWLLCVGLLVMGLLSVGGGTFAGLAQPQHSVPLVSAEQASLPQSSIAAPQPLVVPSSVGMSDLMSQTFEFGGAFPAGWQVYDAISPTVGLDYFWSTTAFTRAEGASSAVAVQGGRDGATLTDTADYTAAVDSWMVYGPVNLSPVWQAQLAFAYHFTPTASGSFTVAVSTNYDPISMTGKFSEEVIPPTTGWTPRTLDLSPYAGRKVYVAFRYQTPDGGNAADGPFVDDVHVRANYRALLPLVSKWMLALSKSASSNVVGAGQSLVYSLTVYNKDATAASGVLLTDTVPTGTVFVSADGGGTFNAASRVVSWSGLTVPAQSSVVRHLTIAVPSGDLIGFRVVNKDYAISVPPNPVMMFGLPVTTPVAFDYLDDFSNPASGWPIGSWTGGIECNPPPGSWRAGYMTGGTYGVNTGCAWNGMIYPSPVRIADTANFTLEVDLRSNQGDLWYSSYGVFFNGGEDLRQMYIVRLFQGREPPEFAVYRWPNFQGSSNDQPPPIIYQWGTCNECDGADYAWNHIVVRRHGAWFEVYMGKSGGALARQATIFDDAYIDSYHARVGVHHGNFEWRGDAGAAYYAYVFDNFRLSPATR